MNPAFSPQPKYTRHSVILASLFLAAVTLIVYWEVTDLEFVDYDDNVYVTRNPAIQKGVTLESLAWALTTTHTGNWHPLTWLSHMLDYEIYGSNPAGHHATNLLFHAANVVLVFFVLVRMTGDFWRSVFAAALFAA
ncbi:MAG: hypothetical protein ACE5GQ_08815, partial [Nitrospinales bacterium]